ncbi:36874_t:CDS:2, partial [Racocetra persica]
FAHANIIHRRNEFEFNEFNDQVLIQFQPPKTTTETIHDCGNADDILQLEYLKITPDPPEKGHELHISAVGYLSERVMEGSYINLIVKFGMIKLLQKRLDLCEQVEKVDKTCPLEEGKQTLEHTVELPKEIPPGKYFVDVQVYTPDNRRIACLKATAAFRP